MVALRSLDAAGLVVLVLLQQKAKVIISDLDLVRKAIVPHLEREGIKMLRYKILRHSNVVPSYLFNSEVKD